MPQLRQRITLNLPTATKRRREARKKLGLPEEQPSKAERKEALRRARASATDWRCGKWALYDGVLFWGGVLFFVLLFWWF